MQNRLFHPIFTFIPIIEICPDCTKFLCPCLYTNTELHGKNQKVRLDPRENMPDKTDIEIYVFPENTLKRSRKIFAYFDFLPGLRVCYTSKS